MIPSEENRDGRAISSFDCVQGAETRANAGFVLSMLRCICVQLPADAVAVGRFLEMHEAAAKLDMALPRVHRGQVGYKGLGGNRSNTFFRMVAQRRPYNCFCSALENGVGVTAEEKLRGICDTMADACRDGVPWLVLSSAVLRKEKEAEYIIQAAGNLVGACRVLPGFLDAVARFCKFLLAMTPGEVTGALQNQIPHLQKEKPDIVKFCERMGGPASTHIKLWQHMTNHLLTKSRFPKANVLHVVTDLSLKWPDCKMAMLWCAQNCPDRFCEGEHVTWISKSDVVSARAKVEFKEQMDLAQAELAPRFEKVSAGSHLSDLQKFGGLWQMVGRFLLQKKHSSFKEHNSLHEISAVYDQDGDESCGSGGHTPCPSAGNASCAAIQDSIKAEMVERRVVKYVDGKLVDEEALLREAGLVQDVMIRTTDAKLQSMKAMHSRGRGSIIQSLYSSTALQFYCLVKIYGFIVP